MADIDRRGGDAWDQPSQYRIDDAARVGGGKRRGREREDQGAPQEYRDPFADRSELRAAGLQGFLRRHQLAAVFTTAAQDLQSKVVLEFRARRFFMKLVNVSNLGIIAASKDYNCARAETR